MYPEVRVATFSPPLGGARARQAVSGSLASLWKGENPSLRRWRKSFLEKVEKSMTSSEVLMAWSLCFSSMMWECEKESF